jgi:tetratricopeptide (TPR) repeat protein
LKKIVESVDPSKRLDTCPRTCIYGLDGVGKTELALEAAWRLHDAKKPDNLCSIFWVSASTETSFEKGYRLIGKTLQLDPERKTFTQVVEIVNDRLRTRPGPWLLIVDDVKEWMDDQILPQGPNGSILATAASSSMASRLKMQFYYLEHLSLEEAIDLLKLPFSNETFINAENVSEANTLVSDHLLYHPLAIKLASKYMKVQGASITGYLALFKGQSLNNQGLYPIDRDTQRAVAEAWLLSFEKIKNGNKAALPILKRIAFCEEKNIHVSHLQIDIDDRVLNTLVEYSFVVKNIIAKRIDVHQLVQMAMIDWFQSQGTFDKEARLEVETQLEKLPFPTSASKEQWEESLPHAERALEKAEEAFRHPDRDLDLPNIFSYGESGWRLLYMVGQANFMLKRYEKAKKFHLRALDLERAARTNRSREKLAGAEDSEQGDTDDFSMNDLSALMQRESRACRHLIQGPHSEGSKELLEVWEKAKSHLGEAHPLTINTLETLAYALKHQDNIDDAVTRFEEVLRLKRESLPRDSRSILKSIENLAAVYQQQGIYDKAQILLQEAVQLCAKVHGSEHEHDPTVAYREQLRLLAELQELERIRAKLHGGM